VSAGNGTGYCADSSKSLQIAGAFLTASPILETRPTSETQRQLRDAAQSEIVGVGEARLSHRGAGRATRLYPPLRGSCSLVLIECVPPEPATAAVVTYLLTRQDDDP